MSVFFTILRVITIIIVIYIFCDVRVLFVGAFDLYHYSVVVVVVSVEGDVAAVFVGVGGVGFGSFVARFGD